MRKVLLSLAVACVALVAIAGLASGATTKHCGTTYTPTCTKPKITTTLLVAPACRKHQRLPSPAVYRIGFYAIAGIRKVQVTVGATVLFSKSFKGIGPQHYTIKHLVINKGGGRFMNILVKDINGRTARKAVTLPSVKSPCFTG